MAKILSGISEVLNEEEYGPHWYYVVKATNNNFLPASEDPTASKAA